MSPQPFDYGTDYLTINIPTNCPAALHRQLLIGINAALKQCLLYPIEGYTDAIAVTSLADLQKSLLPTEEELESIVET